MASRTKREIALYNQLREDYKNQSWELAITHINQLIKIRPNDPVYYLWLGDCYKNLDKINDALRGYQEALILDKQYPVGGDFRREVTELFVALGLIEAEAGAFYLYGNTRCFDVDRDRVCQVEQPGEDISNRRFYFRRGGSQADIQRFKVEAAGCGHGNSHRFGVIAVPDNQPARHLRPGQFDIRFVS